MWLIGTRVLKLENKKMILVLAVGSAVCGCSAMAALAPSLKFPKVRTFCAVLSLSRADSAVVQYGAGCPAGRWLSPTYPGLSAEARH